MPSRSPLQDGAFPTEVHRVAIAAVAPQVACGRFPAKCVIGDAVRISADLVVDGHEVLAGRVLHRPHGASAWHTVPLLAESNDRWAAAIAVDHLGRHEFLLEAWIDRFATWRAGLRRKLNAEETVATDLLVGAELLAARAERASRSDSAAGGRLSAAALALADAELSQAERLAAIDGEQLAGDLDAHPDDERATRSAPVLELFADPPLARFSAWYEFFPRSCGAPGEHGTLRDAWPLLEHAAALGFDVAYLPPIHPIGTSFRKGPNNTLHVGADDPGSPWAIGSPTGGHKAVHPELGTLEDFDAFVAHAHELGLQVALDIALQCSPDHPYVREHPEWFQHRPDGTIQYAENPPKKYQDICPFDFECAAWRELWEELHSIFAFWCERGIRVFRVDNPHTKALDFWEWCIARIKTQYPEAIFLAEAFTRPKLMYRLGQLGFSQSYTYFTWRRFRDELETYLTELTHTDVHWFFRPNFWPNTPDILPDDLKGAPRGAFAARAVLAATLTANWGVYGPAFELFDNVGREGSGEYLDNEKYELKDWDLHRADSLAPLLRRLNRIRRAHPALQRNAGLRFHPTDNDMLICYSKTSPDGEDCVVTVVNLDYHYRQTGWLELSPDDLGIPTGGRVQAHDLLADARYDWRPGRNYIELDPTTLPAHVLHIRRFVRRERDFDYFA